MEITKNCNCSFFSGQPSMKQSIKNNLQFYPNREKFLFILILSKAINVLILNWMVNIFKYEWRYSLKNKITFSNKNRVAMIVVNFHPKISIFGTFMTFTFIIFLAPPKSNLSRKCENNINLTPICSLFFDYVKPIIKLLQQTSLHTGCYRRFVRSLTSPSSVLSSLCVGTCVHKSVCVRM